MRRRVKLPPIPSKSKSGPVTTRSLSSPRNGWTLQQAMSLVSQGYTPARVEQLTGWNAKHLEAQLRRRAGDGAPDGDGGAGA
ncbi:MAG TPA: hypothetical protein VKP64_11010 [Mycobacteriales bacterium]|nr:hypothetical protein [Mycobacteriales bacterium]